MHIGGTPSLPSNTLTDTRTAAPYPRHGGIENALSSTKEESSPFTRLTQSRTSTWRGYCMAFTGLYTVVAIYVALAVTLAFSAPSYINSVQTNNNFPQFMNSPDTLIRLIHCFLYRKSYGPCFVFPALLFEACSLDKHQRSRSMVHYEDFHKASRGVRGYWDNSRYRSLLVVLSYDTSRRPTD